MYIWRVNKLVEKFRAGEVTERQQLYYLLVMMALTYVVSDPYVNSLLAYETMNTLDILMLPIGLVLAVAGTLWCYYAAQGKQSPTGFIARYICLGLPVLVRILVLVLVVMFTVFAINDFLISISGVNQYLEAEQTTVIDFIGIASFEVLYFFYLRQVIKATYA